MLLIGQRGSGQRMIRRFYFLSQAIFKGYSKYDEYRGVKMPVGYRVAYLRYDTNTFVLCPIGLHLLVRWVRRVWEWSFQYRPSAFERAMDRIRYEAFHSGCDRGERNLMRMLENMGTYEKIDYALRKRGIYEGSDKED